MNYAKNNKLQSLESLTAAFLITFRSEHTRLSYHNDLSQFFKFCKIKLQSNQIDLTHITETLCFAWRHSINDLPNPTISRKLSSVSSFFKFCERQQLISINPTKFLQRPKATTCSKTNILNYEEIKKILEYSKNRIKHAEIYNNTFQYKLWQKRYVVLHTLFSVGMRVEELCKLKCNDIEHIEGTLYRLNLITKGNKIHAPIIHPLTAKVLLDYIQFCNLQENEVIFKNIHRSSIYRMVQKCVKIVGISKKISPHSFRASLATYLHQTGVPLGEIKDLLNHKNIATTVIYTKVSDEELQNNANILEF